MQLHRFKALVTPLKSVLENSRSSWLKEKKDMAMAEDDITERKNWTICIASSEDVASDISPSSMRTPETHVNTRCKSMW